MKDMSGARLVYEFGGYRLDPRRRVLSRVDGNPVPLKAKVFDTLLYLVEHNGELLDKGTLMEAVWPKSVVEESNLNKNVSVLRQVLGETPNQHRFIVTEPGRGYRFVAEVRRVAMAAPAIDASSVRGDGDQTSEPPASPEAEPPAPAKGAMRSGARAWSVARPGLLAALVPRASGVPCT